MNPLAKYTGLVQCNHGQIKKWCDVCAKLRAIRESKKRRNKRPLPEPPKNSEVTTHPCTCKKPNPMKIVATEQEIVDAIKSKFMKQEIDLEGWSIDAILEALKSLPTLKDELEGFLKWWYANEILCYQGKTREEVIDMYLATHSKQG